MYWNIVIFCGGVLLALTALGVDGDEGRREKFRCRDGSTIEALRGCDGVADCADGADETVRACAGMQCPSYTFQCAYGACVDQGSKCDGKRDCPDGSDEDAELCGGAGGARGANTTAAAPSASEPGPCSPPPQPDHGRHSVSGSPGNTSSELTLEYSCDTGYGLRGRGRISCAGGRWSHETPQCLRFCRLDRHPSVEYLCAENTDVFRPCSSSQPSGSQVFPRCRSPEYYSRQTFTPMRCLEGSWDYIAICKPDCGRVTAQDMDAFSLRALTPRHQLPWHARVYRRRGDSYKQVCSGSIISSTIVVSVARCFTNAQGSAQPAGQFAVAAAKVYQPWDDARDYDTQTSEVAEIKIPSDFRGILNDFQDDIALLVLSTSIAYQNHVRPVCLDFDELFERQQLQSGNLGKVAGRVSTAQGAAAVKSLRVLQLPFVNSEECLTRAARASRKYFTGDKICAEYTNDTRLCANDNGGGLAFLDSGAGAERYYLRGVLAATMARRKTCYSEAVISFTAIARHEYFIKKHIDPSLIGRIAESGPCRLPPYPAHGGYAVTGRPDARPGDTFDAFLLNYSCDAGYGLVGKSEIYCYNGYWAEKSPYCIECGLETPVGQALVAGGVPVARAELPWHVGVYEKNGTSHKQICGGTIVSTTVVISAAHCFWTDALKLHPASQYAVAAGKLHRAWASALDGDTQTRDVAEIKIPSRFRGARTNFQDDIALLVLGEPLAYRAHVRPVCLDFGEHFEKRQLQPGHLAKVAGWGYTSENGTVADTLRVATLPYVDVDRCLAEAPPTFYQYITSDKICAGYSNGTALCRGDSGGGLVFPQTSRRSTRYYLRGVVSTAPNNQLACNTYAVTSFTKITKHESFIRRNLGDADVSLGGRTEGLAPGLGRPAEMVTL